MQVLSVIPAIPEAVLKAYSSDPILIAACRVIENSFSEDAIAGASEPALWRPLIDLALRRPKDEVHDALRKMLRPITVSGAGGPDIEYVNDMQQAKCH